MAADYRKTFSGSGAKSDPQDAHLRLERLRCHRDRLRVWRPDDARTRQLILLVEHRRDFVDQRTRLTPGFAVSSPHGRGPFFSFIILIHRFLRWSPVTAFQTSRYFSVSSRWKRGL